MARGGALLGLRRWGEAIYACAAAVVVGQEIGDRHIERVGLAGNAAALQGAGRPAAAFSVLRDLADLDPE